MRVEHTVLLGLGQAREQRQHLGVARERAVREVLAQMVGCFANFALAGQKNKDVARRSADPNLVHGIRHRVVQVVVAAFLEGTIALLDRIGAARHHQHGRSLAFGVCKVLRKPISVDGGRGHDDFQIGPLRQDLLQIP